MYIPVQDVTSKSYMVFLGHLVLYRACFLYNEKQNKLDPSDLTDLARKLRIPHIIDFIAISSYGRNGDKRGEVRFLMDTRESITDKHVLIVEDILDSGHTLSYLTQNFEARHPLSVKKAVFLDKPSRHEVETEIHYKGFDIPDVWVVGYGLDYKEEYRTLPYIAEMIPKK